MNFPFRFFCLIALLVGATRARADFLPNNFWPNATFENGVNLDQTNGTPAGWNQGGSDPTICQVTTNNFVSPTHALIVNDADAANYGEWYSDLNLAGLANPGDALNLRYYEMYSVSGGEMRLSVLFFDSASNILAQNHFTVSGNSPGWAGGIAASTFTKVNQALVVPAGAVRIRVSVVSGGPSSTTGVLVVDDLSVARAPIPSLLPGNFWPNASFETGSNLDTLTGTPAGWNRGGSLGSICQVTTNNYVSASHALIVSDADAGNYGEWYADQISLAGHANPGDSLILQWFELYSVTNGEMRVTVTFFDSGGTSVGDQSFTESGQSPGWQGAISGSGFTLRNHLVIVPPNAAKMRLSLVSGGPSATVGVMLIDDLSVAAPPPPLLTGNFWPNPMFEIGTNLNRTNGLPANWIASGSDTGICQITTNNYISPTHALALIDGNTNGYAEWDSDLVLSTNASPGDLLDIQYSELFSITNGPMRLTVLFFNATSNVVGQSDFTVSGQSLGWQGSIAGSTFDLQKQQVLVPNTSVRIRLSLVSGGPSLATGVFVVDNLSVARHFVPPPPPTVHSGTFFPNPTFEQGAQLDNPALALPTGGWQRGGSDASIDQVTTNNSVSPTHSLSLLDNNNNGYGEWYMFVNLAGLVSDSDAVDIQWFQLYSTTNGSMRLSFAFLDTNNSTVSSMDFGATGQSSGWNGSVDSSTFERQFQRLEVPVGTAQLRVNFASGGASDVTGTMVVDDLSVRLSKPFITGLDLSASPNGNLTWFSMASKTYTVQFASALGSPTVWTSLTTGLPGAGLTTSYLDIATHAGKAGFYRVIQE